MDIANQRISEIRRRGLTIYDVIGSGDPHLWIPTPELKRILTNEIVGVSLKELPLRTRSKVVKEHVCLALGYKVPSKFARTQPRFVGQDFDVYVQKSGNLQIWNEELDPERRYVIVSRRKRHSRGSSSCNGKRISFVGSDGHSHTEISGAARCPARNGRACSAARHRRSL